MWASATLSATPTKDAKKSGSGFADMKALNPSYMSGSTAVEMKSPGSKKPSHWTDSEKDTDLDESGSAV